MNDFERFMTLEKARILCAEGQYCPSPDGIRGGCPVCDPYRAIVGVLAKTLPKMVELAAKELEAR